MKLTQAISLFLHDFLAAGNSPNTARVYQINLNVLSSYLKDKDVREITEQDLRDFFYYLKMERSEKPLSGWCINNYLKTIRAFCKWLNQEFDIPRADINLKPLKFAENERQPLTFEQLRAVLETAEYVVYRLRDKVIKRRRPTGLRNKALLMLMLDTGLRAGEVCRLEWEDIDLARGEIRILIHNRGIKSRPRIVYLGKQACKALQRYYLEQGGQGSVFNLTERGLRSLLKRIGDQAGVHLYPHLLRHTFAVMYLKGNNRAKGDIYSLQRLLGHATLDMVKRYLNLANEDVREIHREVSPADRLLEDQRKAR
ncbi:MAG: tyrosine-type recombinase/integrase [Candidatus Methanomethylicaceae archaeon]